MTTVSLVEDDSSFSVLLARSLAKRRTICVLSVHPTGEGALQSLPTLRPDVVLVDIKLPGINGIECLKRLCAIEPPLHLQFLVLTDHADSEWVFDALQAGANGYLLKDRISPSELAQAIMDVMSGGAVMSPTIARKVIERFHRPAAPESTLSGREREVLLSVSRGLMNKEISGELSISENTVRKHVSAIYRKLHVQSRAAATRHFLQRRF